MNQNDVVLPDREKARAMGWTYQVQWVEDGNPCFVRCKSGRVADAHAHSLRRQGLTPTVIDLKDALQEH